VLNWMNWIKGSLSNGPQVTKVTPADRQPARMSGKYQLLYKYLENRYATTVVLTLTEIEDILGFKLPPAARTDGTWWTIADPHTAEGGYSDAWKVASRTAVPNLPARNVVFERSSSYAR
jgi:hypothetical protein